MPAATGPALDLVATRARFPALARPQIFADNAGGSQVLDTVIESITAYFTTTNVQLGATYAASRAAGRRVDDGFERAAGFVGAAVEEIAFGSSTTQLLHNLSTAIPFAPTDEIILSAVDHEANLTPWLRAAKTHSLLVKWWHPSPPPSASLDPSDPPDPNPRLTPASLLPLLSEHTRLVACTHASNILGTIHDIRAIAAAVHAAGPRALLCVDGVAFAPHRRVDVKELDVDFYVFSWYKVYGPHISQLYSHQRILPTLATLGHYFNPSTTLADRIGLAGSSYELTAALPAVVEYLTGATAGDMHARIAAHEGRLQAVLLQFLRARDDVVLYGEGSADPAVRVPTVSFSVRGWEAQAVVEEVEAVEGRVGIRAGHMYAKRLVDEVLGAKGGVVRISLVHYNTEAEAQTLVDVLSKVLDGRKGKTGALGGEVVLGDGAEMG